MQLQLLEDMLVLFNWTKRSRSEKMAQNVHILGNKFDMKNTRITTFYSFIVLQYNPVCNLHRKSVKHLRPLICLLLAVDVACDYVRKQFLLRRRVSNRELWLQSPMP